MSGPSPLPLALAAAALVVLLQLLRTRRMREKYAILWSLLGTVVIVLALFPVLLKAAADLVGVAEPTNLLFFASGLVLYLVCIQLSVELSRLEEDRRVLVEEVALLRLEVETLAARVDAPRSAPDGTTDLPPSGPAAAAEGSTARQAPGTRSVG